MIALIWIVFTVLALLWTGLAAFSVNVADWVMSFLASSQVGEAAADLAGIPVPAWLSPWIDPALLEALKTSSVEFVQTVLTWMPSADALSGGIGWLIWTVWGVGFMVLLMVTAVIHWLVGRAGFGKS